jgi:hypothetical protein
VDNDEIPTDLDDAAAGGFDADFAAEGNNNSNTSSANYSVASARRISAIPHSSQSQVTAHAHHACRRLPALAKQALSESECKISLFKTDENELLRRHWRY